MTIPEDIPQPTQPDVQTPSREDRPRRPRRELPKFPDSPIVIPPERVEAAKDLLGRVHEMWEQGSHYDSLIAWFDVPMDQRDDVINTVLLQEAEPAGRSLRSAQDDMEGKPEHLILKHYALLTTPAVGKIIRPDDNDPITENDVDELRQNPGVNQEFRTKLRSLGLGQGPYYHDMDDFTQPNHDITRNFSLDEEREFLANLMPHISGSVKEKLLSSWGVVSGIQHADLLTDPRLTDALEKPLIGEVEWMVHLENYLAQGVFPSAEFLEEAFKRLKPEDSSPNAKFLLSVKDIRDIEVPASVFYFTMLRRIVPLKSLREKHPEYGKGTEEKITAYLLNNAFMERAFPYLETNEAFGDNFITGYGKTMFHNVKVEATGKEAKALKRERLGEVINTAIEYARQKGDEQTVQKLTEIEVGGVKFADLISHK